ncbi:MAG: hypothetical protein ACI97B_002601, partial [Verrucomicrobiales bacterium]
MNRSSLLITFHLLTASWALAVPEAFQTFDFGTDPGWTINGDWAFGTPLAFSGDPSSAKSGSNVYGNNLSGTYPASIPAATPYHLTTPAIDCTSREQVKVGFWRWLRVESPTFDKAFLHASNDGINWVTVWVNTSSIYESSWSYQEYDISAVADNQPTVYLRWGLGPTSSSRQYGGWNLDDIRLLAENGVAGVSVSAPDAHATESGQSTGTFTFTRTGSTAQNLTANYTIAGTSSGSDYATLAGTIEFPAGVDTQNLTVTPVNDDLAEGPETVIATVIEGIGYSPLAPTNATITIADNDQPTVTVTASISSTSEDAGSPGPFTVNRTAPLTQPLSILYTVGGSATQGTDYPALSGTVILPAGSSSATIPILPTDDNLLEGNETVSISLRSNGIQYLLGGSTFATITIIDDEQSELSIQATDSSADEDSLDIGVFTLTRSPPLTDDLAVNLGASGTAVNGADYAALPSSVVIPAGMTSQTITVTPIDDSGADTPETVVLTLQSGGLPYRIASPSSATVTITDSDALPGVSLVATTSTASERFTGTANFRFTRSGPTTSALTVDINIAGTASPEDASSLPATITFAAGASTVNQSATAVNDTISEGPETIIVTVTSGAGYGAAMPDSATITIIDN